MSISRRERSPTMAQEHLEIGWSVASHSSFDPDGRAPGHLGRGVDATSRGPRKLSPCTSGSSRASASRHDCDSWSSLEEISDIRNTWPEAPLGSEGWLAIRTTSEAHDGGV